jgi:hypothetical protein
VEVPGSVLAYLLPGTRLGARLHATGKRWRGDSGTYTLTGSPVTSSETLGQMNVPGQETCIEVGKRGEEA